MDYKRSKGNDINSFYIETLFYDNSRQTDMKITRITLSTDRYMCNKEIIKMIENSVHFSQKITYYISK